MKVFISYSVDDTTVVRKIAEAIRPHAEPCFWGQNKSPGEEVWKTIQNWIDSADCVVAVITDKVVARGESVNQEIGYAKKAGKLVIPLIASNVPLNRLGMLASATWITFDPNEPSAAIDGLKRKLSEAAITKQQQGFMLLLVVAITLFALSSGN